MNRPRRQGSTAARALVALFSVLSPPGSFAQNGRLQALDSYIEWAMADWGTPGLAIAVVRNDSVIYTKGYGIREMGKPDRVDDQTMFAIGSQTKAFTGVAVAMLGDEGHLGLDDPIIRHLAGFELANACLTAQVTLRDLLTHRTGLPGNNLIFWGTDVSRREVVARLRYLEPTATLRGAYQYQNLTYITAGEVVGAVSGVTWDDFVRQRILAPLGMTRSETSVGTLLRTRPPNVATPHARYSGRLAPVEWLNLDNAGPAGSMISTARDMAEWLRFQLANGTYAGRRLLSETMMAETRRPQMIVPKDRLFSIVMPGARFIHYGFGWWVHDYRGELVVEHGGQTDAMRSIAVMLPERQLAVEVLTNEGISELPAAIAYRTIDVLLGKPEQDWSTIFRRGLEVLRGPSSPPARETGTQPSVPLDRFEGTYRHPFYGDATVRVENGALTLQVLGLRTQLGHWHYDTFRMTRTGPVPNVLGSLITFAADARAQMTELRIQGGGGATFRR